MTKVLLVLAVSLLPLLGPAPAKETEDIPAHARVTQQVLPLLDKRLGVKFDLPFPKDWDIDDWRKRPMAAISVDTKKMRITQPFVNPWDGSGTIEWMIGPESDKELMKGADFDCMLWLDEKGDFDQTGVLFGSDDWPMPSSSETRQLERAEGESGTEFFKRAMLTYRLRAQKAKQPAEAMRYLAIFEKVATAIQELRKEAAMKKE